MTGDITIEGVLDVIDSIPEKMCGGQQPRFLYDLSMKTQGRGRVVEIGTCAGKSTIALSFAQKSKQGTKVCTIDIAEHPDIASNLDKAGVAAFVLRFLDGSASVAARWDEPVELLWIDGDHSYAGVLADIQNWSRFVIVGGVIAFHDYPSPGGCDLGDVGRAVYECILSRPDQWRVIADREAGSILAFERLRTPSECNDRDYRRHGLWNVGGRWAKRIGKKLSGGSSRMA